MLSEPEVKSAETAPTNLAIDPFGFMPGFASRIAGLGGPEVWHDPAYAFHTPYVRVARGAARFTIRFRNLAAKKGALILRISMLPLDQSANARLVNSERIALNRLIAVGGEISIAFEGYRGMIYAIVGMIAGDTDARADAMEITLDRPDDGRADEHAVADARSTVFGVNAAKPVARLISTGRATITDPVSQMCTASQFDEPAFAHWAAQLREPIHRHRKQWEAVYILQVLSRYGMLEAGARGLGFGCGSGPLPAAMAAAGVQVVATDLPGEHDGGASSQAADRHGFTIDSLRRSAICDDATFERAVSFRAVEMTAIPDDLLNFDFAWSAGACEQLGSIAAGLKFVEDSIECLRPGGLAVHSCAFEFGSDDDAREAGDAVRFRRRDMERLALTLISRGHEVAQIKLDAGDMPLDEQVDGPPDAGDGTPAPRRYATTSFGIIVRKAATPI